MAIARRSKKRDAILSLLQSTKSHPSANWVYGRLRAQFPDVSLGTVYRNLNQLTEEGLIVSVGVINGQECFDGNITPHAHFICDVCGRIYDVELPDDGSIERKAEAVLGARVESHELKLRGVCARCLSRQDIQA